MIFMNFYKYSLNCVFSFRGPVVLKRPVSLSLFLVGLRLASYIKDKVFIFVPFL